MQAEMTVCNHAHGNPFAFETKMFSTRDPLMSIEKASAKRFL
jgi:hypothetical protein